MARRHEDSGGKNERSCGWRATHVAGEKFSLATGKLSRLHSLRGEGKKREVRRRWRRRAAGARLTGRGRKESGAAGAAKRRGARTRVRLDVYLRLCARPSTEKTVTCPPPTTAARSSGAMMIEREREASSKGIFLFRFREAGRRRGLKMTMTMMTIIGRGRPPPLLQRHTRRIMMADLDDDATAAAQAALCVRRATTILSCQTS